MRSVLSVFVIVIILARMLVISEEVDTNRKRVEKIIHEIAEKNKNNPDIFIRFGVIADRKNKKVDIYAETTGIGPLDPVEFFLIGPGGSHDYESIAVSFAEPTNILASLEFIGMKRGRPVDYRSLNFWPKGERVIGTIRTLNGDSVNIKLEDCVVDDRTGKKLGNVGFVFVGSKDVEYPAGSGKKSISAQVYEPNSIISVYNEHTTILDIPFRFNQGTVYGHIFPNTEYKFKKGGLVVITLTPQYTNDFKRVIELVLDVKQSRRMEDNIISGVKFDLKSEDKEFVIDGTIEELLKIFTDMVRNNKDPFVKINFAVNLNLREVYEVSRIISQIDSIHGIRVEAPPVSNLYYEAFLPNENLRYRDKRIVQPWEVYISGPIGNPTGTLYYITSELSDKGEPVIDVQPYPILQPDSLIDILHELSNKLENSGKYVPPKVVVFFADQSMKYGDLIKFTEPIVKEYQTIRVYLQPKPSG